METSNCKKVNGITSVMNKYSTFFFDMDGVIVIKFYYLI